MVPLPYVASGATVKPRFSGVLLGFEQGNRQILKTNKDEIVVDHTSAILAPKITSAKGSTADKAPPPANNATAATKRKSTEVQNVTKKPVTAAAATEPEPKKAKKVEVLQKAAFAQLRKPAANSTKVTSAVVKILDGEFAGRFCNVSGFNIYAFGHNLQVL